MKTQHQNPEFGDTGGEIQKKPAKNYLGIQGGGGWWVKLRKPWILAVGSKTEFHPVFPFS
jgi:hypothetical protein